MTARRPIAESACCRNARRVASVRASSASALAFSCLSKGTAPVVPSLVRPAAIHRARCDESLEPNARGGSATAVPCLAGPPATLHLGVRPVLSKPLVTARCRCGGAHESTSAIANDFEDAIARPLDGLSRADRAQVSRPKKRPVGRSFASHLDRSKPIFRWHESILTPIDAG